MGAHLQVPLCVIQCGNRSRLYPLASVVRTVSSASMLVAEAALGMLGGARSCSGERDAETSEARTRMRGADFIAAV